MSQADTEFIMSVTKEQVEELTIGSETAELATKLNELGVLYYVLILYWV